MAERNYSEKTRRKFFLRSMSRARNNMPCFSCDSYKDLWTKPHDEEFKELVDLRRRMLYILDGIIEDEFGEDYAWGLRDDTDAEGSEE